ncbi:MAG: glycosyl transferase, partial [Firmicutes bacterium]|nr:glycosyl transferase [Bacillota bacterium]
AFATELLYRMRNEGAESAPLGEWLDGRLAAIGTTAEDVVHLEHQRQSAREISVRNSINSLRGLAAIDWIDSFERLSYVERILQTDPDGTYPAMDNASRDLYRHRIEKIASLHEISELQVARQAIQCAKDVPNGSSEFWRRHVGYYLIDEGEEQLLSRLGQPVHWRDSVRRSLASHRFGIYLGAIGLLTLLVTGSIYLRVGYRGTFGSVVWLVALVFLASDLAVRTVHGLVTVSIPPRILPKLELRHGIPEEHTTMVVIPALLSNKARAQQLIDGLEVYYLANQESNLFFALLGDFADAAEATKAEDEEILKAAKGRIDVLNQRYAGEQPIFHFFHRVRLRNDKENCHMGWERKRGKLEEFNRLLRGAEDTTYVLNELPSYLARVRHVITLDADTGLPRDTARRLVGTLIHPLNHPVLDEDRRQVVRGYGLLQPRINIVVAAVTRSLFTKVFAGDGGIDPYTTAVSDVYQDLFGEGIYTGKGIYNVDIFNAVLGQRLPDDAILSHDLLEGAYVRAGLATDIELIDGYPARYDAYALRLHRWVRGDWQLLPWLLGHVPSGTGKEPNPLSPLARWKIGDNLRRSLIPPALLVTIVGGLSVFDPSPAPYLGLAALVIVFPWLTMLVLGIIGSPKGKRFLGHVWTMASSSRKQAWQAVLTLTFLPYQAYLMADAAIRTWIRLYFTRRNMLEWVTAADLEERLSKGWRAYAIRMWPGQILAIVSLGLIWLLRPNNLVLGVPLSLLWLASPWIAHMVSKPSEQHRADLTETDRQQLRIYARQIWRYFEDFVDEKDNWLPPDHYQESPKMSVAHRTSPTNIGLYLLSILGAWDLGYIGVGQVLDRVEASLASIARLEKWHGHLYNWYDTKNLQPLRPFYISTVDSGNLVGYLIALRQGLLEIVTTSSLDLGRWQVGLADTFALMRSEVRGDDRNWSGTGEAMAQLDIDAEELFDAGTLLPSATRGYAALANLERRLGHITKVERSINGQGRSRETWTLRLAAMVASYRQEIEEIHAWAPQLMDIPAGLRDGALPQDVKAVWASSLAMLNSRTPLLELPQRYRKVKGAIDQMMVLLQNVEMEHDSKDQTLQWLGGLKEALEQSGQAAQAWIQKCYSLAEQLQNLVANTEFQHLYDEKRHMFSIGHSLDEERLTRSYYDLLASEARQASFVAIAKGDVPQKHWFKLGRAMVQTTDGRTLLSWSGTMFEYLMPLLVMESYPDTLLAEALAAAVGEQMDYGRRHRVPWGISECGFSALNVQLNYQYQAFGVPTIGLKRGLAKDLVIAPYASFLALMVDPGAAYENLKVLAAKGLVGLYGMYEAIDFTRDRVPGDVDGSIVRMYMAHHLGMSFLALDNYINGGIMRHRFHSDPYVQATDLLLQERLPRHISTMESQPDTAPLAQPARQTGPMITRQFALGDLDERNVFLASNGAYAVMLSTTGSGYSQWEDIAIGRWRRDATRDQWGMFFYIKDLKQDRIWSATYQPTCAVPDSYEVEFADDRAEFVRWDGQIKTKTEVTVSSEHNAEVRRISLTNHGQDSRLIEVTSYFEVVLDSAAADLAHPAFSNLFIQTEFVPELDTLLAYRRPRHGHQQALWLAHTVTVKGNTVGEIEYETDRGRLIGRGHDRSRPESMDRRLSGRVGAVLDPCMSLRRRVRILPGKTVQIVYTTALARTRSEAIALAKVYHEPDGANRVFAFAWARSQVELRYLDLPVAEAHLFQTIASRLVYGHSLELAERANKIAKNRLGQPGLWALGLSGELPILLVKVQSQKEEEIVRQALVAHEYWRMKGLAVDLVLLNLEAGGYEQAIQDLLRRLMASGHAQTQENRPGGVFLKQASHLSQAEQDLLEVSARVVIGAGIGSLSEKARRGPNHLVAVSRRGLLARRRPPEPTIALAGSDGTDGEWKPADNGPLTDEGAGINGEALPTLPEIAQLPSLILDGGLAVPTDLEFFNGFGGFSNHGRQYTIFLSEGISTPAPWINVISNPNAGFLISESGAGYTWTENSRENKLTPWSNDPIIDPPGEALYLQDLDTGDLWSPTASPIREPEPYLIHHGQGYSQFAHTSHGIKQTLWTFVPLEDPVKIYRLQLNNESSHPRRLAISFYVELTLGVHRQLTEQQIVTSYDAEGRALCARSTFRDDIYSSKVAFATTSLGEFSYTGDRREFIGPNGSHKSPAGLKSGALSGAVGPGLDPCMAIKAHIELEPGDEKEVIFVLGEDQHISGVRQLAKIYQDFAEIQASFEEVQDWWDETLGVVEVETPNQGLDLLVNRWLLYQNLACRIWGRSAFYQAGGAYGYRDQLQDVMALLLSRPDIAREHILRASAHQYVEGDVQHWWHPDSNKGVRTRFSDDLLWLPLVTEKYVEVTGDESIWAETVRFLEDEPLGPDEQERYGIPRISTEKGSVLQHCWRAIDHSLRFGEHGLPLMGSGDWNDGMSKVGWQGRGESVWMGWFLYTILMKFVPIAKAHGEDERSDRYLREAKRLAQALHQSAWDGEWYRRAYFDDGTPLGSAGNEECRIDSISQSWSVISGAADPQRAQEAMRAVGDYLVREEDRMILLLTPAFDRMLPDPGYIQSYVPGVRENGGQYTHAAMWVIMATAILGEGARAMELFDLVNPIHQSRDGVSALQYRVEPYVVAADVSAVFPNTGRGGWTWYTGASGWMYQVAVEWLLGLKVKGDTFSVYPCIPPNWPMFKIRYRYQGTTYAITVHNPEGVETGVVEISLNGQVVTDGQVPLADDGGLHNVTVTMGKGTDGTAHHSRDEFDELVSVT